MAVLEGRREGIRSLEAMFLWRVFRDWFARSDEVNIEIEVQRLWLR